MHSSDKVLSKIKKLLPGNSPGKSDILDEKDILSSLKTKFIGRNILIFDVVSSTNVIAKEKSDLPEGTVFIAETQTDGRGRLGREWISESGEGLWFSVLLKPGVEPDKASVITLVAGMAVCEVLGAEYAVKWPNDIVTDGKKVCGILTEMTAGNVICGIGVNVNNREFFEDLRDKATSVYIKSGKRAQRNALLADILNAFERLYFEFTENGFDTLADKYKSMCITIGKIVSVSGNITLCGMAEDITATGELIVRNGEGRHIVNSGEVSVRGIYGYI